MTVSIGTDIHFTPADVRHKYHAADSKCHAYGVLKIDSGGTYANLYFSDTAHVDAVIAALVALKQEMDPPVITDSERTCPHSNNGEHCTQGGDHGVHRDSNGDEWRTDTSSFVGRIVEDAHDDSPCPVTGKVVRQIDGETVEVQWDGTSSAMREPIDALRPARKQAASVTA